MDDTTTLSDGDALFTPAQASKYMGGALRVTTLAKMRWEGRGPRFLKLGGHVRYRRSAIDAWLEENEKTSTSSAPRVATA